ncbi:MAG: FtsX-like permease family protein [Actinomycetota bacterium]|nr:FtsX-like permease family protein [Actinomycetota bacterium]
MRTSSGSLRLAARLARREVVRRPWRTLLVALLVALPVAAMTIGAVLVRTDSRSALEDWQRSFGGGDVALPLDTEEATEPPPIGEIEAGLPPGSRAIGYRSNDLRLLRTEDGLRTASRIAELAMADPLGATIYQVLDGREPASAGEVFLTRRVAADLDVAVGDVLDLVDPAPATWTVVGVGERRDTWGVHGVVVAPGTPFPWRSGAAGAERMVLVDLPEGLSTAEIAEVPAIADLDGVVTTVFAPGVNGVPTTATSLDAPPAIGWTWVVGAVGLTMTGIVIAAAFAASARRQLTMLGQLSANGAAPRVLRRVLFLQGTWTGFAGTALGVGLAAAVLAAVRDGMDSFFQHDVDPYALRLVDLGPIVLLGVGAATIAALVPARANAHIPVLAALAGRRPLRPVPRWLPIAGLAATAGGLALLGLATLGANGDSNAVWILTAVVGSVAILLGSCAVAPTYVAGVLEPLAKRARGAGRIAARSLVRQRTRAAAVVAAVCATGALAVGASGLVQSFNARETADPPWMRPDEIVLTAHDAEALMVGDPWSAHTSMQPLPDGLVAELQDELDDSEIIHLRTAIPTEIPAGGGWGVTDFVPSDWTTAGAGYVGLAYVGRWGGPAVALVADELVLDRYDLPAAARVSLDEHGAVVLAESAGGSGSLTFGPGDGASSIPPIDVDVVDRTGLPLGNLPPVLLTPERADVLGLVAGPEVVALRTPEPLTATQRAAVQEITDAHRTGSGADEIIVQATVYNPPSELDQRIVDGALAAVALVLSLFVVAATLALSAAETRDERDVLLVVGAPPSTMRRTSGARALLLTALGTALAIPVGLLPVSVFAAANDGDLPLVVPWRIVALLVIAVPLVAGAATTVASGLTLRFRPISISTVAHE